LQKEDAICTGDYLFQFIEDGIIVGDMLMVYIKYKSDKHANQLISDIITIIKDEDLIIDDMDYFYLNNSDIKYQMVLIKKLKNEKCISIGLFFYNGNQYKSYEEYEEDNVRLSINKFSYNGKSLKIRKLSLFYQQCVVVHDKYAKHISNCDKRSTRARMLMDIGYTIESSYGTLVKNNMGYTWEK